MTEQDRFRVRRIVAYNQHPRHRWHRWFAWHPIQLTNKQWVCFKWIYRRALYKTYSTYDSQQQYEYGTVLDVLQRPSDTPH